MKKDIKLQKPKVNNKKQYQKPCLKHLGDIRDVTMGGSPGVGDSGGGGIQKPF
jgi:hypothetical protein